MLCRYSERERSDTMVYWLDYGRGTQAKVSYTCARETLGLSIPLGASVWHPSSKIRVSTVSLEVEREASQVAVRTCGCRSNGPRSWRGCSLAGVDGERISANLVEPWQANRDRDKGNPERGGDRDWAQ